MCDIVSTIWFYLISVVSIVTRVRIFPHSQLNYSIPHQCVVISIVSCAGWVLWFSKVLAIFSVMTDECTQVDVHRTSIIWAIFSNKKKVFIQFGPICQRFFIWPWAWNIEMFPRDIFCFMLVIISIFYGWKLRKFEAKQDCMTWNYQMSNSFVRLAEQYLACRGKVCQLNVVSSCGQHVHTHTIPKCSIYITWSEHYKASRKHEYNLWIDVKYVKDICMWVEYVGQQHHISAVGQIATHRNLKGDRGWEG